MCDQFIVGQTHIFSIGLRDSTNGWVAKANPTIDAANDFQISINGAGWEALDDTPTVSPSGGEFVDVTFSVAETTATGVGGNLKFRAADADGLSGWIGGVLRFVGVAAAPSTLTAAEVNAEVDQAITDANLATAASIASLATAIAALNTKLGSPAGATVSADIASIQTAVDLINDTLVTTEITVVSVIDGDDIELYRNDTWRFTATVTGLTLTDYEAIALVVKKATTQTDEQSVLYVRSDVGLLYLAGTGATAGDGALTIDSATAFSVNIKITVTDVEPGHYTWALKVFDTTPGTDEGYTKAKGKFTVKDYWLRATA